jgi:hypothetical protein
LGHGITGILCRRRRSLIVNNEIIINRSTTNGTEALRTTMALNIIYLPSSLLTVTLSYIGDAKDFVSLSKTCDVFRTLLQEVKNAARRIAIILI